MLNSQPNLNLNAAAEPAREFRVTQAGTQTSSSLLVSHWHGHRDSDPWIAVIIIGIIIMVSPSGPAETRIIESSYSGLILNHHWDV